jgi:hypothetical protein
MIQLTLFDNETARGVLISSNKSTSSRRGLVPLAASQTRTNLSACDNYTAAFPSPEKAIDLIRSE